MKLIVSVFAVLMMVAGMATAAPSIYGSNGLIWTISPDNAGTKYGIGVNGALMMKDSSETWPHKYMYMGIMPGGYFSINEMFEISFATTYQMYTETVLGTDESQNGLLDTRFGVKYSMKASDMIGLGAYVGYDIPTQGAIGDSLLKYSEPYKHTGTLHALLLAGFKFGEAAKLDLNAGLDYNLDKDNDSTSVYPNMAIPMGIAFSYKAGIVKPFIEFTTSLGLDSSTYGVDAAKRSFLNYNSYVTPGIQVCFPFGMALTAGFSYNLIDTANGIAYKGSEVNPDWIGHFGLSYAPATEAGPKVPPTGIISGKVTDKAGKGLAATVFAGGITANTDPATGAYTLSGVLIDKTPVQIKAEAKAYITKEASVMLTKKNKKTPAMQDFTLELKPIPVGAVKGMVKDALTGTPVEGALAFTGPKAETAKIAAGEYNAKLQIGNYNVTSNVAGYINKKAAISIVENGTAMNDFMLYQNGAALPVNVVWTAVTKYTIKSVDVANIVAALNENPNAKIAVKAYVDAVSGTATKQKLATKRADAIKAEIIKAGIAADRIMAEGIVVAPRGKTIAERKANTKVEAVISE